MKKRTRNILIIVISLFVLILIGTKVEIGNGCVPEIPEHLSNIPKSAKWYGGCDGGFWIEINQKITDNSYKITVYYDYSGEIESTRIYKLDCSKTDFSVEYLMNNIVYYDFESILFKNGKFNCLLIPKLDSHP